MKNYGRWLAIGSGLIAGLVPHRLHAEPKLITQCEEVHSASSVVIGMVFFDLGSSKLTVSMKQILESIVAAAKEMRSANLTIVGFTDQKGIEQDNIELSNRRVGTVNAELSAALPSGVALELLGCGEMFPLVPLGDGLPHAHNRRVEIRSELVMD